MNTHSLLYMHTYTCISHFSPQATFCGSNLGKERGYHFSIYDLERMGYHFCDTLLDYCDPDQTKVTEYPLSVSLSFFFFLSLSSLSVSHFFFIHKCLHLSIFPFCLHLTHCYCNLCNRCRPCWWQVNLIMEELREEYRQSLARKLPALGYNIPPGMDLLDLKLTPDMMAQLESRYYVTNNPVRACVYSRTKANRTGCIGWFYSWLYTPPQCIYTWVFRQTLHCCYSCIIDMTVIDKCTCIPL